MARRYKASPTKGNVGTILDCYAPPLSLLCKVGSIVVHVDEAPGIRQTVRQAEGATMWFELKGDERIREVCTTDDCCGQPTWRLEASGYGSNYCSGCKERIERAAIEQGSGDCGK